MYQQWIAIEGGQLFVCIFAPGNGGDAACGVVRRHKQVRHYDRQGAQCHGGEKDRWKPGCESRLTSDICLGDAQQVAPLACAAGRGAGWTIKEYNPKLCEMSRPSYWYTAAFHCFVIWLAPLPPYEELPLALLARDEKDGQFY
jgi:hypothetical protein